MKAKEMLAKGFLPKEFPNLFDSKELNKSMRISDEILVSKPTLSIPIKTSIPKGGSFRRNISIPNPKHFTVLSKFIAQQSKEIKQFFKLSKISMSKAVSNKDSSRAIVNEFGYDNVLQEQLIKGFSSKFLITADISKFYNTIYTHSIPWAIHGKIESKRDRTDSLWGNKLDRLVRNMQDGQTLGIPIGPDTSRVISEIIGVALDKDIQSSETELNGIRFIDDFFLFADSYAQAENLELKINRALSDFELTNNENKSSIQSMPVSVESIKFQAIKNYKIRKSIPDQKLDIIHIYNRAIELNVVNPHENSFHCFLTKILPIKIHNENWDIVESILLQIASAEIKSITVISKLLISYKSYGYDLNLGKIKTAFLKIAQRGIENNFGFEVCWSFFILDQLGIKINEKINNISSIGDPLAILSILAAREKGLYTSNLDLNYWNTLLGNNGLYDSCWMLCYEAEKREWLRNQNGLNLIDADSYFKKLNDLDVSFLNMDCTINPIEESELSEESDAENEPDIFDLIYG
jgi:hypothetical protein